MKRTLVIGLGLVLSLLVLVPAGLLGLMASEGGSRWLLLRLEPILPLTFEPENIQGRILGHLEVHNISLNPAPHKGFVKKLELDWQPSRLLSGELHIKRLLVQGLDFEPGEAAPESVEAKKDSGELEIALPIKIQLDDVRLEDASIRTGDKVQRIEQLALRASTQDNRLVLESLTLSAPPLKKLSLRAALGLASPHALEALLDWQLELPEIGALEGQGRIGGDLNRILLEHEVKSPFQIRTKGSLSLGAEPQLDLANDWQAVQWPFTGQAQFASKSGQMRIKGPLNNYLLQVITELNGTDIPNAAIKLNAQGSTESITIKDISLALLGGEININGQAAWVPAPRWDMTIEARDLQPGKQWPEVPGRFSLQLASNGELIDGKPHLTAELKELKGLINTLALSGQGKARLDDEHLRLEGLDISAGKNQLRLHGELAKTADFQALIEAPELAKLWPGLKGSLKANARLQGELQMPDLRLEASGAGLGFGDQGLKSLEAKVLWNPKDAKASSTRISLKGLASGKPILDSLNLSGPGNLANHQWTLDLKGPGLSGNLALKGGVEGASWRGQLQSGKFNSKEAGQWQLAKAFGLTLGSKGQLDEHCWQSRGGAVCLNGRWNEQQEFAANASIKALPLAILEPFLPPGERISGSINAQAKAGGSFAKPRAELNLQLAQCSYQPNIPNTKVSVHLRDLKLDANLANELLKAKLDLGLKLDTPKAPGTWGSSSANLALHLGAKPRLGPSTLKLNYPDIANVGFLVPAINKLKGQVALDIKAQGALDKPNLQGGLRLENAGLELPDTGIKIEGLALSALMAGGQQVNIKGQASSGGGRLELDGRLDIAGTKPRLDASLRGQNFQVARIPMAEVLISPDIKLNLKDNNFLASGNLLLPKAIIKLKELPEGSVAVSDDVVIIDDAAPKTAKKEELPPALVNARIDLRLGDEVSFSGFGLKTKIQGRLNIESTPGKPPLGNGNLNLVDGSFKAFGQDLSIERGRFLFSGPLDQPGLDIQAVRQAKDEDVKAGVMVTGPVKNPEVKVFSIPPKPTSEALSYLLTGSGLKSASPDQASAINSAAYSMQKAGANLLTGGIAKQLGLSDFSFGGESAQTSALNLGKQLSPDLYVRYVRNLFDNTAAMEVGYKINKVLDLKVYGGSNQGVDLYYHKEK